MNKLIEIKASLDSQLQSILYEYEKYKDYTFLILGKSGPTGKTWFSYKLERIGLNVINLSEEFMEYITYKDKDSNFIYINNETKIIVYILNKKYSKGENKTNQKLEIKDKQHIYIQLNGEQFVLLKRVANNTYQALFKEYLNFLLNERLSKEEK